MEQTVIVRHSYQEQQSNHLHTMHDGEADRIGTHFQQDPYQIEDSRRQIGPLSDISSQRLPLSSVEVASLDHENATKHIPNTTPFVLEKDALNGVNIESNPEINRNCEDTKPIVNRKSKKRRVASLDHENATKHIPNTTPVVLEKDTLDGVSSELNLEINRNCEDTKPVVNSKSKKKRARKKATKRGVGSMTEETTSLDHQNVVPVSGVPNSLSTGVPTNAMMVVSEKAEMAGLNVDLCQECQIPDETKRLQNTTAVVLENNKITGVNVDLNNEVTAKSVEVKPVAKKAKKRKKCRSSSSKSVGEPMSEEMTDLSRQRLPVSSMVEISLDHESVVVPDSGVTDVVSTHGSPRNDDIRAVMANGRLVKSEMVGTSLDHESFVVPVSGVTDVVTEKLEETKHIPSTTVAVLDNDKLAVASIELSHEASEKLEETIVESDLEQSPSLKCAVESDLERASVRQQISPANTITALLEKDEISGVDVELSHVVNEKSDEIKDMQNTANVVLEKDEMAGVSVVLNRDMNDEPKEANHESVVPVSRISDVVSTKDLPRADVMRDMIAKYGPFESEFAKACEKYFISRANATKAVLEKGGSHGENADLISEVNEKLEETKLILNNTTAVLEKDEMAGSTMDLSHEVNEKLEETKHPVKTKSKKRKIKQPEETTQLLNTGKDEMAGVNIDLNHDMNKMRKKLRSSSSKCDVDSVTEQVSNTPSLRLQTDSTGEIALNHESVMPVSVVTDGMSISVPTDVTRVILANDHPLQSRRKLLVLDVNGLLADIVVDYPPNFKPDFKLSGKVVFKRPFCDEFLNFCFENFDVGIWSSRTRMNLARTVDVLLGNTKNKLLFCWDKSHCTETGFNTLENFHKPLVLKELSKLWEKKDNDLPWQSGFYNESNTILLDDSPYKALRNPPFTAVFPHPYSFRNIKDASLGPNGDLRLYLKRLAEAENVQQFIEANPFGQRSITVTNPSWSFYSKIAEKHTIQQGRGFASTSSGHYFPKRRRLISAS